MRGAADAAGRVGRRTVGCIHGAGAAGGVRRERGRRGDGDLDGEIVPRAVLRAPGGGRWGAGVDGGEGVNIRERMWGGALRGAGGSLFAIAEQGWVLRWGARDGSSVLLNKLFV